MVYMSMSKYYIFKFINFSYMLILFMMGLGVSLRYIQGIPVEFFASFYSGLGPMLLLSAFRFLRRRSSIR